MKKSNTDLSQPLDIATRHSLEFQCDHLPEKARILEIGCGNGELAAGLQARDFAVTAIDSNADAVNATKAKGVTAHQAEWPATGFEHYDAICFTRSLHHIHDLEGALVAAQDAVVPGGILLVEDFSFDGMDEPTITWFAEYLAKTSSEDSLKEGSFARELLLSDNPVAAWRSDHGHDLHGIDAMRKAVSERFAIKHSLGVPYLYRYLIDALNDSDASIEGVLAFFGREKAAIDDGAILPLGRRIVAVR